MRIEYLELLKCPKCDSEALEIKSNDISVRIREGSINCLGCHASYPIENYIPRFSRSTHYADSFGPQWRTFAKSQIDTDRTHESAIRFDSEIGWQKEELKGRTIIEFGSGAGRFVDVASKRSTKLVVGLDATDAVDAAQDNLADRKNVLFVQGDIFSPPFRKECFDFGYSIGVLHHTPDPEAGFRNLAKLIKAQGSIAVSLYDISLYARPNRNSIKVATLELLWALNVWRCELFRTVTTRIPSSIFLSYCKSVVLILHAINKIPILRYVRYCLPSTCYRHLPVIWSMVDTHDTYATKIVHHYRAKDIFQWFLKEHLWNIVVTNSRAGWVSIVANKSLDPSFNHEKYIYEQPFAPGIKNRIDKD